MLAGPDCQALAHGLRIGLVAALLAIVPLASSCVGLGRCVYKTRGLSLEFEEAFLPEDTLRVKVVLQELRESSSISRFPSKHDHRRLLWTVRSTRSLEEFERILVVNESGNALLTLRMSNRQLSGSNDPESLDWQAPIEKKCYRPQACYDGPLLEGQPPFLHLWKWFKSGDVRLEVRLREGVVIDAEPVLDVNDWNRPYCS